MTYTVRDTHTGNSYTVEAGGHAAAAEQIARQLWPESRVSECRRVTGSVGLSGVFHAYAQIRGENAITSVGHPLHVA